MIPVSDFTIKQIFIDHWNNFVSENSDIYIRPIVFDEVEKIIKTYEKEINSKIEIIIMIIYYINE